MKFTTTATCTNSRTPFLTTLARGNGDEMLATMIDTNFRRRTQPHTALDEANARLAIV